MHPSPARALPFAQPKYRIANRSLLIVVLIAAVMPFVALLVTALGAGSSGAIVSSYASSVLPRYALSSIILAVGVAVCATVIGVACAWQIERYRFPGSRWLSWALLLPMTMPAYVAAYALSDFTQFSGPVQSWLRATFGWSKGDYWFPEFASMPGAIAVFSFTLYPYVYLISRGTFASRGNELFEAARTLGLSASDAWRRAVLPMARPAIAGAALLVVMETLADFGTVTYFGVETFTVGIYRAWQNMGDLAAAAQLAIALLLCVIAIVWLERRARRRARYASVRAKRHASAIE
ncbi:MAG: iron ABC transporter permease, partial [Burkholderiales bacterium]